MSGGELWRDRRGAGGHSRPRAVAAAARRAVSIKTLQAAVSNSQAAESSRFVMDMAVDVAGRR